MNKIINVVAIDDNDAVLSSVRKYFKGNEVIKVVGCFNNGKEALQYLVNNQTDYDVILMDILMPQIDGLKMLEELNKRKINKKIVILSSFKDDYTIKKVQKLNASYYMLKPIDMKILEERIFDLFVESDEIKYADNYSVEVEVSSLLHDLGIPSHVRGYKYIREGIMLLYTSREVVNLVTKDIYPEIANRFNTTSSRVERAIRHAIEISWIRGDLKVMEDIFGNSIDFERSKPTNSEFLTTIADRLKLHQKELVG
ncbi:MAG TPA: sporulation transcription factor Spo0A [Candidatus Onthocola stercoravium]|nr:sporulation transcription factor Spo0A [Candidatus Onthocola stercoravium]